MERVMTAKEAPGLGHERSFEIESRVLRSRLVNLTLDWELAALTMDAQRYKSHAQLERESLRDTANTYRKCVAELSEIIASAAVPSCKREQP
jgi:hypothetical protein